MEKLALDAGDFEKFKAAIDADAMIQVDHVVVLLELAETGQEVAWMALRARGRLSLPGAEDLIESHHHQMSFRQAKSLVQMATDDGTRKFPLGQIMRARVPRSQARLNRNCANSSRNRMASPFVGATKNTLSACQPLSRSTSGANEASVPRGAVSWRMSLVRNDSTVSVDSWAFSEVAMIVSDSPRTWAHGLQCGVPFMLIEIKGLHRWHEVVFLCGLLVALPSQLAESFRLSFHAIPTVEPNQCFGRKI